MLTISKPYQDHKNYFNETYVTRKNLRDYYLSSSYFFDIIATEKFRKEIAKDIHNLSYEEHLELIKDLRSGKIRDRQVKQKHAAEKHRVGLDFCFTPAKQISLFMLDSNTRDLVIQAHQKAIERVIEVMKSMIRVRDTTGKYSKVAKESIFATYTHLTTRDLDPNVHTHVLLFNITEDENEKLKAVDYSLFYKERKNLDFLYNLFLRQEFEKNSDFLNSNFRSVIEYKPAFANLRKVLREDFKIENFFYYDPTGVFKVPMWEGVIKQFSKRHEEIVKHIIEKIEGQKLDYNTVFEMTQSTTLETRKEKKDVDMSEVFRDWKRQLRENFLTDDILELYVESCVEFSIQQQKRQAQAEVKKDYSNLSYNQELEIVLADFEDYLKKNKLLTFTKLDVYKFAYIYQENFYSDFKYLNKIENIVDVVVKNSHECFNKKTSSVYFISNKYSEQVVKNFDLISYFKSIRVSKFSLAYLQENDIKLNKQQERAYNSICNNFLTIINGAAGTGKSTIIRKFNPEQVVSIAFTHLAAKNIPAIKNFTIHSFLGLDEEDKKAYNDKSNEVSDKIVVIDEASMINTKMFCDLLETLKKAKPKRIVIMGDNRQIDSIEGVSFFDLLCKKSNPIKLTEINRQKDKEYNLFANALASKNTEVREKIIDNFLKKNNAELSNQIIKKAIEENAKILCNNNEICEFINKLYLQQKKENQEFIITKNDYKFQVYNGEIGIKKGNYLILKNNRKVLFSDVETKPAFAITVAKSQGQTFEKCYYIPTQFDDANTMYTALTRATKKCVILNTEQCDYQNVAENLKSLNDIIDLKSQRKEDIFLETQRKVDSMLRTFATTAREVLQQKQTFSFAKR